MWWKEVQNNKIKKTNEYKKKAVIILMYILFLKIYLILIVNFFVYFVGLWKNMFWSEVRSVYSHNMKGILTFIFLHFYTDIYFFVIVEYSGIIENNNDK